MTYRILIVLLLVLAGCLPQPGTEQTYDGGNRIVYGLTLQPSGFDPHINRSSEMGIPLRQVYDTLVYRHPESGEFVAGLATDWTISDDGLIYTFNLRQDVRFHDGTPFNAEAVAANLDRIINPGTASQLASFLLGPFAGYEVIDSDTIQLKLTEPFSPLLDSLAQVYLGIASPTALAEYSNNRYQFHQVGTGPFIFEEFVPGDRIILRRNPDYHWGPEFYTTPGDNALNVIEFRFFTDESARTLALESNEAQVMGELPPTDARVLSGSGGVRLLPQNIPGQPLQFMMNTQRFPTDSRGVRQALLFGANRNAIADAIFQQFSPVAWGPLAASTQYYDTSMRGLYAHNISQAQSLLSDAGFDDANSDGYVDFGGADVQVDVLVPPWGLVPEVATLLQDQWRTIGIRAVITPVPTLGALIEAVEQGEYNLVAFNAYGIDPYLLNDFYLTGAANNWMGYSNSVLDDVLNEALVQSDPNVRRGLYARAQQIIMDDALILPIRDYVNLNASTMQVDGIQFDPYGWFPLLNNAVIIRQ